MKKRFRLGSKLRYRVFQPATFIFNVTVMENEHQRILRETIHFTPDLPFDAQTSETGQSRFQRIHVQPTDFFEMNYQAEVEVNPHFATGTEIGEVPHEKLPLKIVPFIFPSRYCESDRLTRLVTKQFGNLLPGYSRVQAICNWIYDNVFYLSGSTSNITSAFNTVTERAGVCRDFAHLGIAFCRALDIPARFVSGYVVGLNPPDFHAVFEAYLEGRWYLFDPTRLASLKNFVRVGTGYDAADVAFATIFGAAEMTFMELYIEGGSGDPLAFDDQPISSIVE